MLCVTDSSGSIYHRLLEIQTHRNLVNNILSKQERQEELKKLILDNQDISIVLNDDNELYVKYLEDKFIVKSAFNVSNSLNYNVLYNTLDANIQRSSIYFSLSYISPYSDFNDTYNRGISSLKLNNKLDELNRYLKLLFNIEKIDYINDEPQLYKNGWQKLSTYGQGVKTFINIMISLLSLENQPFFIDEIENGIHYSLFDKMWEIILTISKDKNLQIFATTHSKECIESYSKISKQHEDNDIAYINLSRDKEDSIVAITLDSGMFRSEIEQNHELRAW